MKILWYVQNVLGIGHISRSLKICNEFTDAKIFLVTGGRHFTLNTASHIKHIHLPGILSDAKFSAVYPEDQTQLLDDVWNKRKQILMNLFFMESFDVIVTEVFPFGRGNFRFELFQMLEWNRCKKRPAKLVCSLRDINILTENPNFTPERMAGIANLNYTKILIHADPRFSHFKHFFPESAGLLIPVIYTGYVTPYIKKDYKKSHIPKFVLSSGGGHICSEFLELVTKTSIDLYPQINHELDIFYGPYLNQTVRQNIEHLSKNYSHIHKCEFDLNLNTRWNQYDLSFSLGGYNTVLELMFSGIPGIIYPFTENHEQVSRINELNIHDQFTLLDPSSITEAELKTIVCSRLNRVENYTYDLDMTGVQTTIAHLRNL